MKIIQNQFELAAERINHPYLYLLAKDMELNGNNVLCFINGSSQYKDQVILNKMGLKQWMSDRVIEKCICEGIKNYLDGTTTGITAIKCELNYLMLDIDKKGQGIIRIVVTPAMLARFFSILDNACCLLNNKGKRYLNEVICKIKEKMKP